MNNSNNENENRILENTDLLKVPNSEERALRKGSITATNNGKIVVDTDSFLIPGTDALSAPDLATVLVDLQHSISALSQIPLDDMQQKLPPLFSTLSETDLKLLEEQAKQDAYLLVQPDFDFKQFASPLNEVYEKIAADIERIFNAEHPPALITDGKVSSDYLIRQSTYFNGALTLTRVGYANRNPFNGILDTINTRWEYVNQAEDNTVDFNDRRLEGLADMVALNALILLGSDGGSMSAGAIIEVVNQYRQNKMENEERENAASSEDKLDIEKNLEPLDSSSTLQPNTNNDDTPSSNFFSRMYQRLFKKSKESEEELTALYDKKVAEEMQDNIRSILESPLPSGKTLGQNLVEDNNFDAFLKCLDADQQELFQKCLSSLRLEECIAIDTVQLFDNDDKLEDKLEDKKIDSTQSTQDDQDLTPDLIENQDMCLDPEIDSQTGSDLLDSLFEFDADEGE